MKEPLRALLDTNTYEILYKKQFANLVKLIESNLVIIYGCKIVRDELREIPKSVKVDGKSYRSVLLSLYDEFTKNHSFPVEDLVGDLAEKYWGFYKGGTSKRKIFPDFLIVAVATLHRLDIVVSADDKTMKSNPAKKAYDKVNLKNGFKTPRFITLEKLVKR